MKRLFLVTAYILVVGSLFAQAPESFKYQAAIRDSEGNMLSETSISLKISIIQNSTEGNIVYSESHSTQSNNNGLVNINIGEGSVLSGDFNAVPWADGPFFIHIEVDPEGGNNYTDMGYSELKSVPYALYAENVSNTDDADADPQNEIQDLTLEGNILTITLNNNPTAIDLSPYLDNTDDQILN